jgi:hypothetical protein
MCLASPPRILLFTLSGAEGLRFALIEFSISPPSIGR